MVNKGDYVIRDEEHVMTVGYTPDVLLTRDGEYTKLRDTDVILGKLNIGNVYYNSNLGDNITLSSDIPFKSLKSGNIVIESTYDNGERETNSSLKYLSEVKLEFNIGDKVTMTTDEYSCVPIGDKGEIVKIEVGFMADIPYKVKHSDDSTNWVSPEDIERTPEVKRRFGIGDKVNVVAGHFAPSGVGTVVELVWEMSYRIDYCDTTWYVGDDQCSAYVEPEHEFNVGDKVKFDTFVKGTGMIYKLDNEGYFIETSDVDGYDVVYSNKSKVTKLESTKLKIGDKLEYGKWKLEVIDDELIITNEFPDDVIKLDIDSNGWIVNSRDETIHKW